MQDLHGYANPWPAGGGKNLLSIDPSIVTITKNEVTFTVNRNSDGDVTSVVANGTATNRTYFYLGYYNINGGTILNGAPSGGSQDAYALAFDGTSIFDYGNGSAIANDLTNNLLMIVIANGFVCNNLTFKPMIRLATEADSTFAPYSNICPISGWTEAEIYHEAEYDADADPAITVTFPSSAGTVYGATMTLNPDRTGMLVVDKKITGCTVDSMRSSYQNIAYAQVNKPRDSKDYNSYIEVNIITSNYPVNPAHPSGWDAAINQGKMFTTPNKDAYWFGFPVGTTLQEAQTALNDCTICYPLAEPIEYNLTAEQVSGILTALDDINVIWANTGDVTVTYIAKSAKFSFGSPLHNYNYNNLKLFGNTYIEHGKG